MLEWLFKKKAPPGRVEPSISTPSTNLNRAPRRAIPTIQFDASRVTDEVRADIDATLRAALRIPAADFERVYQAALLGVSRGRDLFVITEALLACDGMDKGRAAAIARQVGNRATSLMDNERCLSLGITHAIWRYSGAPCGDARLDADHKKLDGKKFSIRTGIPIGKRRTWPGQDEGCKCIQKSIIPGLD